MTAQRSSHAYWFIPGFALFPALNLYASNVAEVALLTVLPSLIVLFVIASGAVLALRTVIGALRAAALVSLMVTTVFIYPYAYSSLRAFVEHSAGADLAFAIVRHRYLGLPVAGLVLWAAWWVIRHGERRLPAFVLSLNAMSLVLGALPIAGAMFHTNPVGASSGLAPSHDPIPVVRPIGRRLPDIFYIVLDAYGSSDILERVLGYDNREFTEGLSRAGFTVASRSRSNYPATRFSLASSLNMAYLGGIEADPYARSAALIEDNRVERTLKSAGYRIVRFPTWWAPTKSARFADRLVGSRSVFLNEFSELLFDQSVLGMVRSATSDDVREHTRRVLRELPRLEPSDQPTFAFVHVLCPREPFVFGPNGEERPRREWRPPAGSALRRLRYLDQVHFISVEIRRVVDTLLARASVPPVIILQGDHSPTTSPDDHVLEQDYFGILNAYYLPGGGTPPPATVSPVNSFRIVFNQYLGTHLALLEDTSYLVRETQRRFGFEPLRVE
jgi:hypothetical protein